MKTVRNMWRMDKGLTVLTLVMGVVVLFCLAGAWIAPIHFGYPWYAIVVNLLATVGVGAAVKSIAGAVNG